jgi:hypothetical protein
MTSSSDTVDSRIKPFHQFADSFFTAVRTGDTTYLKAHILFPIRNSSFSLLDESLENVEDITPAMFFKRLHHLFPSGYLKEIRARGDYRVATHGGKTFYWIELYHHDGGVDSNVNWHFKLLNGHFYFVTYTAEAG